jgi:hypothetical protein
MTSPPDKPKRWQFQLKTLFVATLIAAIAAWIVRAVGFELFAFLLLTYSVWLAYAAWLHWGHNRHQNRWRR